MSFTMICRRHSQGELNTRELGMFDVDNVIAIIKKRVGREETGSQRNASCVSTFFSLY